MSKMRFYSTERLGPKQSLTPEGFLLCEAVAIARTGTQLYSTDDLPLLEGIGGRIHIKREAEEVFRAETLASFEGKPVTLDHPDEFVNPDSWASLAKGVTQNVRRGTGIESDLLIADLLITDAEAIEAVRSKSLREVSCGYNAEYEQEMPGLGQQREIVGNHVALVARGRAGPRCSIQDKEISTMPTADKKQLWARIRKAFQTGDNAALENLAKADDAEETEEEKEAREAKMKTGDTMAKLIRTVDALTVAVAKLTKDAEGDEETEEEKKEREAKEAKDAILTAEPAGKADVGTTYTGDAATLASRVEILVPGFAMPTGDSAKTVDGVSKVQRAVLAEMSKTTDGAKTVNLFLAGRTVDALTADQLDTVFVGASELVRQQNNANGVRHAIGTKDFGAPSTPAAMNAANAVYWSNRNAK